MEISVFDGISGNDISWSFEAAVCGAYDAHLWTWRAAVFAVYKKSCVAYVFMLRVCVSDVTDRAAVKMF